MSNTFVNEGSVEIQAVPAKPAPPPAAAVASVVSERKVFPKGAQSGEKQEIFFVLDVNPDCSGLKPPAIKIVRQGRRGTAGVEIGDKYPDYPKDNVRAICNSLKMPASILSYQSRPKYVGRDTVDIDFITDGGDLHRYRFEISVR
jgi:hypothetical protein